MATLSEDTRAITAKAIVEFQVFARLYNARHPEAVDPILAAHAGKMLASYAEVLESMAPFLGIPKAELDAILEEKRADWLAAHGNMNDE